MRRRAPIDTAYHGPHGGLDCGCHIEIHHTDYQQDRIILCPKHAAVDRLIEALEDMVRDAAEHNAYPSNTGCQTCIDARALLGEMKEKAK